jgi:hypothetical protein
VQNGFRLSGTGNKLNPQWHRDSEAPKQRHRPLRRIKQLSNKKRNKPNPPTKCRCSETQNSSEMQIRRRSANGIAGSRGDTLSSADISRQRYTQRPANKNGTNHQPKENSLDTTLLQSNPATASSPRYNRANAETKCPTNLPPRCSEPKHTLPPSHNSTAGACWKDILPSYSGNSNPANDQAIMIRAQGAHRVGNRAPN